MNQFHQFQTNFSGGLRTASEVPYSPLSPISDNLYSPSPPGTRSSTSSSAPQRLSCPIPLQRTLSNSDAGDSIDRKTYSWFPLNKRPRRRYDEIERLYQCSWPDCNKSYGTLNHLNAHVTMQNHGAKRTPSEFKELRKQWRKAKKESEAASAIVHQDNYSDAYDDNHYRSPALHPSHTGLPSSLSVLPHSGTADCYSPYSIAIDSDDIRYPVHDCDKGFINYGSLTASARQRYRDRDGGNISPSWHGHGGPHIPPRPNIQQQCLSSSLPTKQPAHWHPLLLSINNRFHQSPSRTLHQNHVPQNSLLLTPLPISLLQLGNGLSYSTDGYEAYDEDNNSRARLC